MFLVMPPGMTTESTAAKIPCWSRDDDGGGGLLHLLYNFRSSIGARTRQTKRASCKLFYNDPSLILATVSQPCAITFERWDGVDCVVVRCLPAIWPFDSAVGGVGGDPASGSSSGGGGAFCGFSRGGGGAVWAVGVRLSRRSRRLPRPYFGVAMASDASTWASASRCRRCFPSPAPPC